MLLSDQKRIGVVVGGCVLVAFAALYMPTLGSTHEVPVDDAAASQRSVKDLLRGTTLEERGDATPAAAAADGVAASGGGDGPARDAPAEKVPAWKAKKQALANEDAGDKVKRLTDEVKYLKNKLRDAQERERLSRGVAACVSLWRGGRACALRCCAVCALCLRCHYRQPVLELDGTAARDVRVRNVCV
jgi:hypothetical protein